MVKRDSIRDIYDHDEYVYSIDVFVHRSVIQIPNDLILGFRLWDFPLLYVQPSHSLDFHAMPGTAIGAHPDSRSIDFLNGKSCIFKMTHDAITLYLQTTPLYLYLFDFNRHEQKDHGETRLPLLIGSSKICLKKLSVPDDAHSYSLIQGTFNIEADSGMNIGVVDVDVRLKRIQSGNVVQDSTRSSQQVGILSQDKIIASASLSSRFVDLGRTRPSLISIVDNQTDSMHSNDGLTGLLHLTKTFKSRRQQLYDMENQIRDALFDITAQIASISHDIVGENNVKKTKIKRKKKTWTKKGVKSIKEGSKSLTLDLGQWNSLSRSTLPGNRVKTVRRRQSETLTLIRPESCSRSRLNTHLSSSQKNTRKTRMVNTSGENRSATSDRNQSDKETERSESSSTISNVSKESGKKKLTITLQNPRRSKSPFPVRNISPTIIDKSGPHTPDRENLRTFIRGSISALDTILEGKESEDPTPDGELFDEKLLSEDDRQLLQHHRDLMKRLKSNFRELKENLRKKHKMKSDTLTSSKEEEKKGRTALEKSDDSVEFEEGKEEAEEGEWEQKSTSTATTFDKESRVEDEEFDFDEDDFELEDEEDTKGKEEEEEDPLDEEIPEEDNSE